MGSRYSNKPVGKYNNANKPQKLLKDHEEEENKGFKVKAHVPHGKSNFEIYK